MSSKFWPLGVLLAIIIACSGSSASSDESTPAPARTGQPILTPEAAADRGGTLAIGTAAAPTATEALKPTATSVPSTPTPVPPTETPTPVSPPQTPTSVPLAAVPTTPPASAGGVAAPIRGYGFPYELTVSAGTKVVWTNYDAVTHDVIASDGSWGSALLGEGDTFSHSFTEPGRYGYVCKVHPYMTAVVIVE